MRTKFLMGVLLGALAGACTGQTPASSQPPAADPATGAEPGAAAPATPGTTTAAPGGGALTPGPDSAEVPSAARGTAAAPAAPPAPRAPRWREVTVPAGTELPLKLDTALASDASAVEDPVRASLRRSVVVDEITVLPAGTDLRGVVTAVQRSAKVQGRASLAFRFISVTVDDQAYDIRTSSVARQAAGTKKKDATKIGIGAGAGAIIGGIVGGGKGAAIGTAVGGGAGTGMVLATRGQEVRLAAGTPVTVKLSEALTVRVPLN
jgi:hypothetical protein